MEKTMERSNGIRANRNTVYRIALQNMQAAALVSRRNNWSIFNSTLRRPLDMETVNIQGQTYKIGLHGKPFVMRDEELVLTESQTADRIRQAIDGQRIRSPRRQAAI